MPAPLPLALTMGEPAGIGGEITLMAWLRRTTPTRPFLVLDDPHRLADLAARLGMAVPIRVIDDPGQAWGVFADALPVLPEPLPRPVAPGRPDPANAPAVARSIERAVRLAADRRVAGLVTNPIHKQAMHQGGFPWPGHTEFLAAQAGLAPDGVVMMLVCPGLRVVPVTIHVALARAAAMLTTGAIVSAGRITAGALVRDFGLANPRLAVTGLNPHAGEGGAMGDEEQRIVAPAVAALRALGIDASGPWPADTLFHDRARATYDAALCMYHDQALIPVKTLGFDLGVNVTLGLPFIRTSPDHGTAFDLAGRGTARPDSLLAALDLAGRLAEGRSRADG